MPVALQVVLGVLIALVIALLLALVLFRRPGRATPPRTAPGTVPPPVPPPVAPPDDLGPETVARAREHIAAGRYVHAVKAIREDTGWPLVRAKNAADRLRDG